MREAQLVQNLANRLTDSPNGKMLKDERITASLTTLYDTEIRDSIRAVVQLYGRDAIPQSAITERVSKLMPSKKASNLVKKLVSEQQLFEKRYVLACNSCGTPVLEFSDQEGAVHSLEGTTTRKCKICDEGNIQVVEAHAVKEAVYKGLEQGLWLEKLAYDAVKPLSVFADMGQMVETFELDVVAVSCNRIILLECKDTSFGQNDFINLNAKAEEIEADIIGIITTQPLHENVNRLIQRTKEQTPTTIFTVHNSDDSAEISSQIEAEIAKIRRDYLRQLLSPTEAGGLPSWFRWARRPPTRRIRR